MRRLVRSDPNLPNRQLHACNPRSPPLRVSIQRLQMLEANVWLGAAHFATVEEGNQVRPPYPLSLLADPRIGDGKFARKPQIINVRFAASNVFRRLLCRI